MFAPKCSSKECAGLSELPIRLGGSGPFSHRTYRKTEVRGDDLTRTQGQRRAPSSLAMQEGKSPAEGNLLIPGLLRVVSEEAYVIVERVWPLESHRPQVKSSLLCLKQINGGFGSLGLSLESGIRVMLGLKLKYKRYLAHGIC